MEIFAGASILLTVISIVCGCLISLVAIGGTGFLMYKAFGSTFKGMASNRNVMQTGVSAPAVILSVQDTGVTMNDNPQARIRLRVMPMGGDAFEAEVTQIIGRFQVAMLVPNASVMVKFDPNDKTKVAIESFGAPPV
ncbi:MAG: hypothetical protein J0L96_17860 [Anaerolineae bacterium]|nr:hypothetical protein [Anaerolineae bacterium]